MTQRIDIDDFKGVFTHADLSNLPNSISTELKNFRPVNGKLVKTYDLNDIDGVCPIQLATGYSVLNVYTYINENLDNGFVYLATIQKASDGQIWIVLFDDNIASGEPDTLLPFGTNSFWVKGDSMTFNTYGKVMLTNVSVTGNTSANSYNFPASSLFHMPHTVEDTDASGAIAYGGGQSVLGHAVYQEDDVEITKFNDTACFHNEIIDGLIFNAGAPDYDYGVVRMQEASGRVFAITRSKDTDAGYDKLWWYNSGWTRIPEAHFGETIDTDDYIQLLHIAEMDGDLYLVFMHYDDSDTGTEYHYRMSRLSDINGTPTWTDDLIDLDLGAADKYGSGLTVFPQDDVTSVTYSTGGTDYLIVYINDSSASTTCGGLLCKYKAPDASVTVMTKPTFADSDNRSTVGIATAEAVGTIYMAVNNTTDTTLEIYWEDGILAPSSWSLMNLPSSISGLTGTFTWQMTDYFITAFVDRGSAYPSSIATIAKLNDDEGDDYYALVEYDTVEEEWTGHSSYYFDASTHTVHSLYQSVHHDRTGYYYLSNVVETGVSSKVYLSTSALTTTPIHTATASLYWVPALLSYEQTIPSGTDADDWLTSISFLFGDADQALSANPTISRVISIGANPDYTEYNGLIEYNASFGACMGWVELFQSLNQDLDQSFYQKTAQNPIVMDKGILRLYGGAQALFGANEIENLWFGYVDRDFYDELYSPTAGFFAYQNTPEKPASYENTSGTTAELSLIGTGDGSGAETRFLARSLVYDGEQESLLSDTIKTIVDVDTDLATLRMRLLDASALLEPRSSIRATGAKLYSMTSGSDTATASLITDASFILKASDRQFYSKTGKGSGWLWVDNQTTTPVVTKFVSYNNVDYGTITSVTDLGDGFLISYTGSAGTTGSLYNAVWYYNTVDLPTGTAGVNGYWGGTTGVLIDTAIDFTSNTPLGLLVAAIDTDGTARFAAGTGAGDNHSLAVTSVAKHAVLIDSNTGGSASFKYIFNANPYLFYKVSNDYYLYAIISWANIDGSEYPLAGVKSLRVNSDYARVIANRMWQGRVVLDVGGENEEQVSAVTYSELNKLDVTPVSNLIKFHDREGGGITGITEIFGRPVITMKQGISIIDSKTAPASPNNWTVSESVHNIGNIANHGMVSAIGTVYVCYYDGIYGLNANNLAETDQTPTERLKISQEIDEVYQAITDKTAIVGEYNQQLNEIVWNFGSEVWAYSLVRNDWREIATQTSIDILTIDENADLLAFDKTDGDLRSFEFSKTAALGTAQSTWKSKRYAFNLDRKSLVRTLSVYYDTDDDFTINIFLNDNDTVTPDGTYSVAKRAGENVRHIPLKRYARNFQVEIVTEDSVNSFELHKIRLEVEE